MSADTYAFKMGQHRCFVINDDSVYFSADDLIGATMTKEQRAQAALEFELDLNRVLFSTNCLLMSTDRGNILIDAGSGQRPYPGGDDGKLLQNLEALGFSPADIDEIIITHSDYDHIGGILDSDGQPEFPSAHYYLSDNSWAYWSSGEGRTEIAALHDWPGWRIDFVWGTFHAIQDRLTVVEYDAEFLPGFRLHGAGGHRCDHDVLRIESSGQTLIHLADGLIHPMVMANRTWHYTFDIVPDQAIETKERLLEWCASEQALVFATHFPFPGLGTVQERDGRWHWHPMKES